MPRPRPSNATSCPPPPTSGAPGTSSPPSRAPLSGSSSATAGTTTPTTSQRSPRSCSHHPVDLDRLPHRPARAHRARAGSPHPHRGGRPLVGALPRYTGDHRPRGGDQPGLLACPGESRLPSRRFRRTRPREPDRPAAEPRPTHRPPPLEGLEGRARHRTVTAQRRRVPARTSAEPRFRDTVVGEGRQRLLGR